MLKAFAKEVRRWVGTMFGKFKEMDEIISTSVDKEHYDLISKWFAIYSGFYDKWHRVKVHSIGDGQKSRTMATLNMAKVVTQELAKIIFTERIKINIDDEKFSDLIHGILKYNRFNKVFKDKLENMFALGGLVLKAHPKEQHDGSYKIIVTYVTPDLFIPLSWESDEIVEGVFLTISEIEGKTFYLLEFHEWKHIDEERVYVITNKLYEVDKDTRKLVERNLKSVNRFKGLQRVTLIEGLTRPLFQYIKPSLANNFDLHSPLGISIFANSLDTLKAIDIAFDSFIREFRLGRRRIIVPSSAIKSTVDPATGAVERYFDATDEVYEAMNFDTQSSNNKITDNTVELRIEEHVAGINALLNLLSIQTGFSAGTFTFDGQSVKTATEVVSENSKTYQTKQSNELVIEEGIVKFINTLADVIGLYEISEVPENYGIDIYWDDTIIRDKNTDSDFYIKLKNNHLITDEYALTKILDFTEDQAREMIMKVREQKATPDPLDVFGDVE